MKLPRVGVSAKCSQSCQVKIIQQSCNQRSLCQNWKRKGTSSDDVIVKIAEKVVTALPWRPSSEDKDTSDTPTSSYQRSHGAKRYLAKDLSAEAKKKKRD